MELPQGDLRGQSHVFLEHLYHDLPSNLLVLIHDDDGIVDWQGDHSSGLEGGQDIHKYVGFFAEQVHPNP